MARTRAARVQVHEKSILLPLLPLTLLAGEHPVLAGWAQAIGAFSMWPLLHKDGQAVAYAALLLLHAVLYGALDHSDASAKGHAETAGIQGVDDDKSKTRAWKGGEGSGVRSSRLTDLSCLMWPVVVVSLLGAAVLHALAIFVDPPPALPYLHDALGSAYSAAHVLVALACGTLAQLRCDADDDDCTGASAAAQKKWQ